MLFAAHKWLTDDGSQRGGELERFRHGRAISPVNLARLAQGTLSSASSLLRKLLVECIRLSIIARQLGALLLVRFVSSEQRLRGEPGQTRPGRLYVLSTPLHSLLLAWSVHVPGLMRPR